MKTCAIHLDCARFDTPDLATVEAIAVLGRVARACSCRISLENVSPRLRELIELCGLSEACGLGVDVEREPEQRE